MYTLIQAKSQGYAEIGQQKNLKFSFVNLDKENKTITEIFAPIKCRDFLGDALFAEEIKSKVSIFGFSFDPSKSTLDTDKTRFSLHFPDVEMKTLFLSNTPLLHEIEQKNSVGVTIFEDIEPVILYSEGDIFWSQAVFLISFYSFMFKAMCYKYETQESWLEMLAKQGTNEGRYLKTITIPKFKSLVGNLNKILNPREGVTGNSDKNVGMVHNCSGFVSSFSDTQGKSVYSKRIQEILK